MGSQGILNNVGDYLHMRHLKHTNKLILGKSSEGIQILVRLEDREAKSIGKVFLLCGRLFAFLSCLVQLLPHLTVSLSQYLLFIPRFPHKFDKRFDKDLILAGYRKSEPSGCSMRISREREREICSAMAMIIWFV